MKAKKINNPQGKVWARRGQYENALTKSDIKTRPLELSYADLNMGEIDGEAITKRVYFKDIPGALGIKLRDPRVPMEEKVPLMFDLLASSIVDPETAEPIMTADEWGQEDLGFINKVSGAVLGIQFVGDQSSEEPDNDHDHDANGNDTAEAQADPNPFDRTDG